MRSEPETPNAVEANDAWVHAPVPVLETTHLTQGSTSPTAWRWRCRVWGSLLSSPFLLMIIGKSMLPLHKIALFYTTQLAGMSQKAQVALCTPQKPWCDHREIRLQPQPGDAPCGFTHRSSMEYALSRDKRTAFLLDMCRSGTKTPTF